MNDPSTKQERARTRYAVARRIAAVAGVFTAVVALFMAADYYQLKTADPLNTPALDRLAAQLEADPDNAELKQQLRELDLLARRSFFTRQWQIRTGSYLLVAGAVVLVAALQVMAASRDRADERTSGTGLDDPWMAASRARRVVVWGGSAILIAGIVLALRFSGTMAPAAREARNPASAKSAPTSSDAPSAHTSKPGSSTNGTNADATSKTLRAMRDQWPSFRGAGGIGRATSATPPVSWDGTSGKGIVWKSPIPRRGFNSPVVWDTRVFLTGADTEKREVYCYSAETGKRLWTADTEGVEGVPETLPEVTQDTGYAAPTVATDGTRVAAIFGTGILLCLDVDGRRLWSRSLGVPENHYGHSSSLLLYNDTVFVQYDHFGGAEVKAFDAETGTLRWETVRAADIYWASPILVETDDRMRLILNAAPMVAAYDIETGDELWSNPCMTGEIGASPAYAGGRVFVANEYAQAVAIDAVSGETLWTTTQPDLPDAGSPLATDDHLFLPTSFGSFSCVDATTGETVWTHEFDEGGYGSPVLADGRIYWTTSDGVTRIIKAAGTFELIGEPSLGEPSVCTPAFAGKKLYMRGSKTLFCIGPE